MTRKIFLSISAVTTFILLFGFVIITVVLYQNFSDVQKKQLEEELNLAVYGVELGGEEYLEKLDNSDCRLTWIAEDGTVLMDTYADESEMENHIDREEVQEAFAAGSGKSSRHSDTLTEQTIYSARLLSDGTVLRASFSGYTIWAWLAALIVPFIAVFAIAVIISTYLARSIARRIVRPINELDIDDPMCSVVYDELSPLLTRINRQHKEIESHIAEIEAKTNEFEQIISAMSEGLVLINVHGDILSINSAARQIFGAAGDCVGENFLKLKHDLKFTRSVEKSLSGKNSCFDMEKNGRIYRLNINTIKNGAEILGAVVLAFDVTEQANAEKTRREFTANVSHELKTPLQTIMGSAELMESGLVKPEDTSRFIGHIKNEAARLVNLVNDIIHLSQLDESSNPAKETVDLYTAANETVSLLRSSADKRGISISVEGEKTEIQGVRAYLHEIIYNLCDNAIRYNKDSGSITIKVGSENGRAFIIVSDTGIGIPQEHQSRIFERFYRVDKSHSKETGGTGLGLSIVKHAVMIHGGTISLESVPNEGTTIKITL